MPELRSLRPIPACRLMAVLAVVAALTAVVPAPALAQIDQKGEPEELLEEGTKKILRAFELFIMTIPQYHMPEVLPNGDIIIRRKKPGEDDKPPEGQAPETDKT